MENDHCLHIYGLTKSGAVQMIECSERLRPESMFEGQMQAELLVQNDVRTYVRTMHF